MGPITSPRPGPTLAIAAPAPEIAVRKSSPISVRTAVMTPKMSAKTKTKVITAPITESGMARPL